MLASGLQILTKRQDIRTLGGVILHRGQDFFLLLAKPQHQPGLRRNFRMRLLRTAQQAQPEVPTKTGLMLGLGEEKEEVLDALASNGAATRASARTPRLC